MPKSKSSTKLVNRESFLKRHDHLQLKTALEKVEKRRPDFWNTLEAIWADYVTNRQKFRVALHQIIERVSSKDIEEPDPVIHSIRYRLKDTDSLIVKIIQKSALVPDEPQNESDIEKYRNISEDSYYKIITDLIGIRIIIRYRYQWEVVHSLLTNIYQNTPDSYITNWETEYDSGPRVSCIVEKPKAYIKQDADRGVYESIGKNAFDIELSEYHYTSLHYIINNDGYYCEVQLRTIFDEAWCECHHDFVYKTNIKSIKKKEVLSKLVAILSQHTVASESIVNLMCETAKGTTRTSEKKLPPQISSDLTSKPQISGNVMEIMEKYADQLLELENLDRFYRIEGD